MQEITPHDKRRKNIAGVTISPAFRHNICYISSYILQFSALFHVASKKISEADSRGPTKGHPIVMK